MVQLKQAKTLIQPGENSVRERTIWQCSSKKKYFLLEKQ